MDFQIEHNGKGVGGHLWFAGGQSLRESEQDYVSLRKSMRVCPNLCEFMQIIILLRFRQTLTPCASPITSHPFISVFNLKIPVTAVGP